MSPLPGLLARHPDTWFLVDEAFIGVAGESVVPLVTQYENLIVTRTFSKGHSLAGFRVGYAIAPEWLAKELNANNDAYPLARPSQAAAVATLENEDKILERVNQLHDWTRQLSIQLQELGVRTFPTETYFFLADFAPYDATRLAERLREHGIFIKPLKDPTLGTSFMRVTTALPEDNECVVNALRKLL